MKSDCWILRSVILLLLLLLLGDCRFFCCELHYTGGAALGLGQYQHSGLVLLRNDEVLSISDSTRPIAVEH